MVDEAAAANSGKSTGIFSFRIVNREKMLPKTGDQRLDSLLKKVKDRAARAKTGTKVRNARGPPSHTQTLGTGRGVACRRIEEPHTDSGPGRGVASSVSQQAHRPPFLVCLRYVAHVCRCALLLVWFSGAPACRPEPVLHPAIAPPSVTHQRVRATTHTLITRRCL